jgi:uncharacterized protein (TIGR00297 family)
VFLLKIQGLSVLEFVLAFPQTPKVWVLAILTVIFAILGRLVQGVTTAGAVAGAVVCFCLLQGAGLRGLAALVTVFGLTWIATRIGYTRKQRLGTAEPRQGRSAAQVFANLGVAALCALLYAFAFDDRRLLLAMGAALAEAAADTVSSEIGQAIGGVPRLVTTWKEAPIGTDGAITMGGTLAGITSAITVGVVCHLAGIFEWGFAVVCTGAGSAGMLADSLLGATLERSKVVGNNGVNFLSTTVSAVVAFLGALAV